MASRFILATFLVSFFAGLFTACGPDMEDRADEILKLWYIERTDRSDDCKEDSEELLAKVLDKYNMNLRQFDQWAGRNLGLLSEIEFNYAKRFCPGLKRNELRYQEEDTSIGTYLVFILIPLLLIAGISLAVYNRIKEENTTEIE